MATAVTVVEANLLSPDHQRDIVALTAAYARDPMGNGAPLPQATLDNLIDGLRRHPTTLIVLAYTDGQAIGIATCFRGFSTFAARPLMNIHDLAVLPEHRKRGVARQLLYAVERKARALGCCRLTLEVLENNQPARRLYAGDGFSQATYTGAAGGALFYTKTLG